ncbi:hypothetical protein Q31b_17400 [Novipirellula aureliae]|uniref:Uncharacterized protein n=1 Tax=Novipirellula aureliae TaxID=2527966 RepID=A0A5C6E6H7_9BACT|nr:hypothetical protein Q31b_17400 [Novipirellula aureliae]
MFRKQLNAYSVPTPSPKAAYMLVFGMEPTHKQHVACRGDRFAGILSDPRAMPCQFRIEASKPSLPKASWETISLQTKCPLQTLLF